MKTKHEIVKLWDTQAVSAQAAQALATLRCETCADIREMGRSNFCKLDGLGLTTVDEIMGLAQ